MSDQAINAIEKTYGNTALIWAIGNGLEKICEILIPKMSNQAINHVTKNGETALSLAETKKFKNICSLLKARQGDQIDTNTFGKIAAAIIIKLENDKTISVPNKNLFKGAINNSCYAVKVARSVKLI